MSKKKDHEIIQKTKIFKDKDGKLNADVISGKSHHRFIDLESLHQHRDDILKEQKNTETALAKQSGLFWDWYKG